MSWLQDSLAYLRGDRVVGERVVEAAMSQGVGADEVGYRRLTGDGLGKYNDRDLLPMQQDRMQKLAEFLWQSNLLANRLVELPLAYLLAEGVTLQCQNADGQKLLDAFWHDPINNFPLKLEARVRALALLGEQCYTCHVNAGSGFVRLGYLDPRRIAQVVMDPDNPEQPIGVVTKADGVGKYYKYRVVVLGDDQDLFSQGTAALRESQFTDGECLLFQVNKFPNGSRGRSDLLGQMDWLDAYDSFLFGEIDRIDFLKRFVWDVTLDGADEDTVNKFQKSFKAPAANSVFVHNDSVTLEAKNPSLQASDTSESARLLRMHVMGGGTMPEHWFGGGGTVNRATASEMGEPTFKVYSARQNLLKLMLQQMGSYVLMKSAVVNPAELMQPDYKVVAKFPELANKDITKFASALQTVATTVGMLLAEHLISRERGLKLVADVAARFGQEIDAVQELKRAEEEYQTLRNADANALSADERAALTAQQAASKAPAAVAAPAAMPAV